MRIIAIVSVCVCAAMFSATAQDAAKPDISKVIDDIAAVGPDALLAHVKELKTQEDALAKQAADLRSQADQKAAEASSMRARIQAVEKFTTELNALLNPPPAVAATPAAAPVEPAVAATPAPAEPAAAPAPEAAAPPAPAPVEPTPAADMNAAPEAGN